MSNLSTGTHMLVVRLYQLVAPDCCCSRPTHPATPDSRLAAGGQHTPRPRTLSCATARQSVLCIFPSIFVRFHFTRFLVSPNFKEGTQIITVLLPVKQRLNVIVDWKYNVSLIVFYVCLIALVCTMYRHTLHVHQSAAWSTLSRQRGCRSCPAVQHPWRCWRRAAAEIWCARCDQRRPSPHSHPHSNSPAAGGSGIMNSGLV